MTEELFDCASQYEMMLNKGISLSGENQEFFIAGRTEDLRSQLSAVPYRILDFGCGIGKTCAHLAKVFPESKIVGADLADGALEHARRTYASDRIEFVRIPDLPEYEAFDLCYVNGVFHHISRFERQRTLEVIRAALVPGGHLAIFENNPWNPGARLVMHRIPFDKRAILLSCIELRNRIRQAGYEIVSTRSLFYLPRALARVRFIEHYLVRMPLGAQYYVLARAQPA
jgi:SAM-dependent methyltransferase